MRRPTPSDIKYLYETNNPSGKWFCRENMRFAGDTMTGFCVGIKIKHDDGECWPIFRRKNQARPVAFFDTITGQIVYPKTTPWS